MEKKEFVIEQKENKFDLRQVDAWKKYINPKSPTFNNAYRSALAAGYTDETSQNITGTGWWKAKVRRIQMLNKAERILNKNLDMDTKDENGKHKADLVRVQADVAKFIAKTQGKDEGYTERNEVTGKDGSPVVFMPLELMEKFGLGEKPLTDNKE